MFLTLQLLFQVVLLLTKKYGKHREKFLKLRQANYRRCFGLLYEFSKLDRKHYGIVIVRHGFQYRPFCQEGKLFRSDNLQRLYTHGKNKDKASYLHFFHTEYHFPHMLYSNFRKNRKL